MRLAFLVLLSLLTGSFNARAQTLHFGVQLGGGVNPEPELKLEDLELGDTRLTLRLAGGAAGPLSLGVAARETESFGPLGNLAFHAFLDFSAEGFATGFGAEGVLASVAAEAELGFSTVAPEMFGLAKVYGPDPPAFSGSGTAARAHLRLGASYRLSRTFIVSAYPRLGFAEAGGLDLFLSGNARLVKLAGPDDLYLKTQGRFGASGASFGAFGVTYDVNRRTFPNLKATLWLGVSENSVLPGGTVELAQTFRELGAKYTFTLAAEPYRADVLPYRASLSYEQTLGPGQLLGALYGTLNSPFGVPPLGVKLAYALPL